MQRDILLLTEMIDAAEQAHQLTAGITIGQLETDRQRRECLVVEFHRARRGCPTARDGPADPYGWITALRAPAIKKLMADDGPLQLSLSGEQDLAEITSGDFPGERLIACRNPALAADRARKCDDLLAATEKLLAPIAARVTAGRLAGAAAIGVEAGKLISKYKTGKHLAVTITDDSLTVTRRQDRIDAEAALDGFDVLRTPVPASQLDGPGVVAAYKNLKYVERDFRHIKSDDLDLRPVSPSPTRTRPPRATPSPRPAAPPPPRPRPPLSATRPDAPTAPSAACSSTWPP